MKTLAIFSPNEFTYSETFIQAHKTLPFEIKFYYGGYLPTALEPGGSIFKFTFREKLRKKLGSKFSWYEHALINSLCKNEVGCVLAEYGLTACETLPLVKHLQLPLIVHFHGFDSSNKNIILSYANQYKQVFEYARSVIAVSYKMRQDLIDLGCSPEKLRIAHYGPNPEFLNLMPTYDSTTFIGIGRFVDKKAPYLTLAAFKLVTAKYPNAKLILIGEGYLLNACRNLVSLWGLSSQVDFDGVLPPSAIQKKLEKSIAFVQHSIVADDGDEEGTPVAVLEAQAAGLPVISTKHAGIPDVVLHGETGFLVNEQDVEDMAHNMMRILEEDGLAKRLGSAGRQRIINLFTREKNIATLTNIIENVFNP